ncbi:hypothetical protein OS493_032216 [Desmophyllum pertusum]|uniref:Fibronectin type-III domain-containing protein n=1 Tax=Desmophyllum pertusum TaxID=174260 RepID=A0A9W9ZY76_9CNID|nr:hypothetical protein OS493_032216 [Desmophyllum pertusum]
MWPWYAKRNGFFQGRLGGFHSSSFPKACSVDVQSDGFTVDTSPPICSQVWDGKSDLQHDVEYAPSSSKLIISWVCYDNESPIVRYRFSVKTVRTNEYVIPFYALKTLVNSSGSAIITGGGRITVKYEEGQSYHVGIEAVNAVGLKTVNWTNGVVIDSTPPVVKNLKLTFDPKNDSIKAEWTVSDVQSGVESVAWGLGTNPEDNDIKNFTDVSLIKTSILISDVPLKLGRTYFLRLFAVNKAGLSSITSSNGVVIRPHCAKPCFPFQDDLLGFQRIDGLSRSIELDVLNFTLHEGLIFHVTVTGVNMLGLKTTMTSQQVVVDWTPPESGDVVDGNLTSPVSQEFIDVDYQREGGVLSAHWSGFQDTESGVVEYHWCVGTAQGACDVQSMTDAELQTKLRIFPIILQEGQRYFFTVEAINGAG